MLFRNTMILVLVVWLLVGWVRSHQDATAPDDRDRLKRRMLERLAQRGYEIRERERVAEELLARLETHFTSTSIPPSRHQRDHHRSLQRQNTRILQDTPYPEITPYAQVYPQLEILQEADTQDVVSEYEKVAVEMEETTDVLRQYLIREILPDRLLERRHVTEAEPEQTTRRTREERRRLKEEKRRRREEKKKKRTNKKNKQKKRKEEFERSLRNQSIPIHDVNGDKYVDCCPSKLVVVEKNVGKAPNNRAMEIMESHRTFYERVCLDDYLDKECMFPARSLRRGVVTRCAQEYSFTQALIRSYETIEDFKMGYIEMRSGCSCQVSLTHKKKKKRKR